MNQIQRTIPSSLLCAGLTLSCSLTGASISTAQESATDAGSTTSTAPLPTLEPSVVTGSRVPQSITDTPYSTAVIDRSEIENRKIRTVPDAFDSIPGVLIQKTSTAHGSPYIRGFTGRSNLLLVDGIRMNNSTWRSGPIQYWNTFDLQGVETLELIKGQGSVLYGSDAIGGTANILTKSSDFKNETGDFMRGRTLYRYETNSKSHVGRLEAQFGKGEKWGVNLGLSAKDAGDIRDSEVGRMPNTGYTEQALDFKFEYALSDATTLTLAHQYYNQDDGNRWHRTTNNPGWIHNGVQIIPDQRGIGALTEIYDQERSLTYARLEGSLENSFIDSYVATLSYQKTQDSTYRDRTNTGGNIDTRVIDLETYGADLQFNSEVGPGTIVYGMDYYRDEASSTAARNGVFRPSSRPVADNSSYDLFGVFGQYQWQATEQLEITAGARYSYAQAKWGNYRPSGATADRSGENNWDDLSLSLRANYELDNGWSMYGGVSEAFRAPNLNDLTGNTFSLDGINSTGSVGVSPEEFINYEIGVRHTNDKFTAGVAAYYNDFRDQITNVDNATGGTTASNGGDGYIFGLEMDASYRISSQWELRAYAAFQDGKQQAPDTFGGPLVTDTVRRMHPIMGGASARWTHPNQKLWIEGRVKAAARANNLSADAASDSTRIPVGGTPSYFVTSVYSGYHVNENLEINLGLENITDESYRYHGAGQNEPGFNAVLGFTAKF